MAMTRSALVLAAILSLLSSVQAVQHTVGESVGWIIPNDKVNYTAWALSHSFHTGDSLLFSYPQQAHSVMEVNRADYTNCVKENPINYHSDGKTVIRLSRPGPHWFICGVPGHCEQGQKFEILVTPLESGPGNLSPPLSAPSGPVSQTPAPAPSPFGRRHHSPPRGPPSGPRRHSPSSDSPAGPAPGPNSGAGDGLSTSIKRGFFLALAGGSFFLALGQ